MLTFRSWRWSAIVFAISITAPAARAELITSDSIPNPPSAVSSANGTPVSTGNAVIGQYSGFGLLFPWETAITRLNGVSVWAPVNSPADQTGQLSKGAIIYHEGWGVLGRIVRPISLNPTTVSSLTVKILGSSSVSVHVYGYGPNGHLLNITPSVGSIAGEQDWTFSGPGIGSFYATQDATSSSPWGVAAASLAPAPTPEPLPEPGGLVLAGLGALGLASRLDWRRNWRRARPVEE
jgi:hypothetical protein